MTESTGTSEEFRVSTATPRPASSMACSASIRGWPVTSGTSTWPGPAADRQVDVGVGAEPAEDGAVAVGLADRILVDDLVDRDVPLNPVDVADRETVVGELRDRAVEVGADHPRYLDRVVAQHAPEDQTDQHRSDDSRLPRATCCRAPTEPLPDSLRPRRARR